MGFPFLCRHFFVRGWHNNNCLSCRGFTDGCNSVAPKVKGLPRQSEYFLRCLPGCLVEVRFEGLSGVWGNKGKYRRERGKVNQFYATLRRLSNTVSVVLILGGGG